MKKHLLFAFLFGVPVSVYALFLSFAAFAYGSSQWRVGIWLYPLGLGGIWAVFTGMRNLLRFDTAHLHLRWHDWIGGTFGFLASSLLSYGILHNWISNRFHIRWTFDYLMQYPIFLSALASAICFCIVAFRFFKHRKKHPCKN